MWSLTLFLLAFAVSLDSLGVGVTYGLRNIRIPLKSVLVIAFCSGAVMFISMEIGTGLAALLPVEVANTIGAAILIGIGFWALYSSQGAKNGRVEVDDNHQSHPDQAVDTLSKKVLAIEIKRFGLVIQILKKPVMADVDRSGTITIGEAILLGCALSLDALGAGLAAAMIGLSLWTAPLVIAIMSAAFLLTGLRIGFRFQQTTLLRRLHYIPGSLLILIGLSRFWW